MNQAQTNQMKVSGAGEIIKNNKSFLESIIEETTEEVINVSTVVSEPEDNVIIEQTELPISDKPGFDPMATQDAIKTNEVEGGITRNTTTGPTGLSGISNSKYDEDKINAGKYEITGFKIQYSMPESRDMISEEVIAYYDTLEDAMASIVEDGIYIKNIAKKDEDDILIRSSITMGAPIICHGDTQKMEYINGSWRR